MVILFTLPLPLKHHQLTSVTSKCNIFHHHLCPIDVRPIELFKDAGAPLLVEYLLKGMSSRPCQGRGGGEGVGKGSD